MTTPHPATDFVIDGTERVTFAACSSSGSNTRLQLWSDPPGANCSEPGCEIRLDGGHYG
jgi:hypothetical protein